MSRYGYHFRNSRTAADPVAEHVDWRGARASGHMAQPRRASVASRLRSAWAARAGREASREDLKASYFLLGEAWMACVFIGVWLVTRFM